MVVLDGLHCPHNGAVLEVCLAAIAVVDGVAVAVAEERAASMEDI